MVGGAFLKVNDSVVEILQRPPTLNNMALPCVIISCCMPPLLNSVSFFPFIFNNVRNFNVLRANNEII